MFRFLVLFFWISVLFQFSDVSAQLIPSDTEENRRERVEYSLVPLLGYSSDLGLYGGALLYRFNYGDNERPYLSNTRFDISAGTKGNLIAGIDYERIHSFGTDIRSLFSVYGERDKLSNYFGIGNDSGFSDELYDEGFFNFESRLFSLKYTARKTISDLSENGILDLFGSVSFRYMDASSRGTSTLFNTSKPTGFGNSWSNSIGLGLIADTRDSEFIATRGIRYEISAEQNTGLLGSEYTFAMYRAELRHFRKVIGNVVLAHKLTGSYLTGDAPFWELPTIGNEEGLRGYYLDRFIGESSILNVIELRSWLFSFLNDEIRLGAQVFWDSGRVFSSADSNRFFSEWKHSYGFGGAISLLNPDFILRADAGISEETWRIYAGIGYIF